MAHPVQQGKLPFTLALFGLELLAVQAEHQLQDESVMDIGVLDLVMGSMTTSLIWRPLTTRFAG